MMMVKPGLMLAHTIVLLVALLMMPHMPCCLWQLADAVRKNVSFSSDTFQLKRYFHVGRKKCIHWLEGSSFHVK